MGLLLASTKLSYIIPNRVCLYSEVYTICDSPTHFTCGSTDVYTMYIYPMYICTMYINTMYINTIFQINKLIDQLTKQLENKGKELNEYREKFNIKVRGDESADEEKKENKSSTQSVLVASEKSQCI